MNEMKFAQEVYVAAFERIIRRLWILCIILILALLTTNAAWIWYESQFEEVSTTTTIDAEQNTKGGGNNTIVGGDYGTAESKNNTNH